MGIVPGSTALNWPDCWRLVPTRFQEERLLERVAGPGDLATVVALEQMTNERLRDARGEISLVLPHERSSDASEFVMAPFAYRNPSGSDFSDGSFGVYYASENLETAISECRHHHESFLRYTDEPAMRLELRVVSAELSGQFHQLPTLPPDRVRAEAVALRRQGADGILFESLRRTGRCAAVFLPRAIAKCKAKRQMVFEWDGTSIGRAYELRAITAL